MITIPPFCPRSSCIHHNSDLPLPDNWFKKTQIYHTLSFGNIQCFRCRSCGKGFSQKTFHLEYWVHRRVDIPRIFDSLASGSGIRQTGRAMGCSDSLIANRHARLSRQALSFQSLANRDQLQVKEAFVFDGFESFIGSQFFPDNTNNLMLKNSQYWVSSNHAILRRKGRMTPKQKEKRAELEKQWKAKGNDLYLKSKEMLGYAGFQSLKAGRLSMMVISDEKKEYSRALKKLPVYGEWIEQGVLEHVQVSSKEPRTTSSLLFAVNYIDREIRKNLAEHVRETVRFGRRVLSETERMAVMRCHHNFFKPYRIKDFRFGERLVTHAEMAGIDQAWVTQRKQDFFTLREFSTRCCLEPWDEMIWSGNLATPLEDTRKRAKFLLG